MLPIVICDDRKILLNHFEQTVTAILSDLDADIQLYQIYSSSQALADALSDLPSPALYFLDVDFPGEIDGFALAELVQQHDPQGFIVFITGYADLAYRVFQKRLKVMDYIVKTDFDQIHKRMEFCIREAYKRYEKQQKAATAYLVLDNDTSPENRILLQDIYYIATNRAQAHHIQIVSKSGCYDIRGTLTDIKKQLSEEFWQCHKSCIVAEKHIAYVDTKNHVVRLKDNTTCPLSLKSYSLYKEQVVLRELHHY